MGGRIHEIGADLVIRRQERFNFAAERMILRAGAVEKGRALLRGEF